MTWAGYVACTGYTRNSYGIARKPEGKISDGGHKRGWDDDIKIVYDQIDCEFMDGFNVVHKLETVHYEW